MASELMYFDYTATLMAGLKSESDTVLVHVWPARFICHFCLCLFPELHSVTVLISPQADPSQSV